jgi:hypothetical protein
MGIAETMLVLNVAAESGVVDAPERKKVAPDFIHKICWPLFTYSVLRNHTHKKIPINELVYGDIVTLRAGDIVPADMRLLTSRSTAVLEHTISGSTTIAYKRTFASKTLLPKSEQNNMLFAGSEILQGVCVGAIVETYQKNKALPAVKRTAKLYKKGLLVQSPRCKKLLSKVSCVVFDDLQQPEEITKLIQRLYLEKGIVPVFFVKSHIAKKLTTLLPKSSLHLNGNTSQTSSPAVYVDTTDAKKATLIAKYKLDHASLMYVHRGEARSYLPKIADINLVISTHASQSAMYHADIITPKISILNLAGILHNNK